jgi:hypothetical protein
MEKILNYSIEKKPLITEEDLLSLGWSPVSLSDPGIASISKAFSKGNYWVTLQNQEGHEIMIVFAKDPTKVEWLPNNPEQFRILIKRPTLEAFKMITSFI